MQSFTYAEYISVALSKVWVGKASIPSTRKLWALQEEHVKDYGGYGRHFQFLGAVRTNSTSISTPWCFPSPDRFMA
jgi:hypothetical protein